MATFRASNTLAAATRTNSTFTKPAGTAAGDIIYIVFDIENDVTPTFPSGFSGTLNVDHASQTNDLWIAWKRCGASEPASYTVTHASSWTNGFIGAVQNASTSRNPRFSTAAQGTGTTATANGLTPDGDNAYIGFAVVTFGDMGAITPPAGSTPTFTERFDSGNNIYVADGTLATAGATGNKSVTFGASQAWIAILMVVEDTATTLPNPNVATFVDEFGTSLGAANAIPSPDGVTAGDLLIAYVSVDNPSTTATTASTGWTQLFSVVQGSNVIRHTAFARVADGGANDALSVTGAAQDYVATVLRIVDHGVTNVATDIAVGTPATGATGNADPPSLDAGSVKDWLWIGDAGVDLTTGNSITAAPTNYYDLTRRVSASSTSSVAQGIAYLKNSAQTENPGTWTNTSRPWIANTIAVPPVAAGGHTVTPDATANTNSSDSPIVSQTHTLIPAETANANSADSPAVSQTHTLAPAATVNTNTATEPTVGQTHTLAPDATSNTNTADSPTVDQTHTVTPTDTANGNTADEPTVTQTHTLTPSSTVNTNTADGPAVGQTHLVTPDATVNTNTADEPSVSTEGSVTPNPTTNTNAADEPAVSQTHLIAPDATTNGNSATSPDVTATLTVFPLETVNTNAATEPTVGQTHVLAPAATSNGNTTDAAAVVQIHVLNPDWTINTNAATSPTVGETPPVGPPHFAATTVNVPAAITTLSAPGASTVVNVPAADTSFVLEDA